MSARIKVKLIEVNVARRTQGCWMPTGETKREFMWICVGGHHTMFDPHVGARSTIAAAADAGRAGSQGRIAPERHPSTQAA